MSSDHRSDGRCSTASSGPDLAQVREIALKLAQVVATSHSAKNVNFDWIEPAREVRIQIDQDQARLLGLSSDALASVLNTVISGISISQVRDDIYLVDVVVRSTDEERASLATLSQLPVPLPSGRTVPLSQFATFEYTQSTPVVWRRDRIPDPHCAGRCRHGRFAGNGSELARLRR